MKRSAVAALTVLAASLGGAAAMPPTEMESGLSSQTAPYRGETETPPKAFVPAETPAETSSIPAPAREPQAATRSVSETQGLAQSQGPAAVPPPPPAPRIATPPVPSVAPPPAPSIAPPAANDHASAVEEQRYSFYRIQDKFLRLDSLTGQVTQCGWGTTGWSCTALPDERAALDAEIARLQSENAALKKALLAHGLELPSGTKPEATVSKESPPAKAAPEAAPSPRVPSQMDFDRAIAFVKDVWRRLVEIVADLQRDIERRS